MTEPLPAIVSPVDAAVATNVAPEAGTQADGIDSRLAVLLCNCTFRMERNLQKMREDGHSSREWRSLRRSVDDLTEALRERGVTWQDLAGRAYDDRDRDFEVIGVDDIAGIAVIGRRAAGIKERAPPVRS